MSDLPDKNYKYLLLSRCYLFSDLSIEELDQLSVNIKIKEAHKNEVIFNKNDRGNEMFVIARGKVSLTSKSEKGKLIQFGVLGEGNIFGEISLFDNHERTATITAVEPTQLLVLEKKPFIDFIIKNPTIAIKLLSAMSARLRYTDQIYEEAVFGSLLVRIAKKLLGIAKLFGEQDFEGVRITITLTDNEIAKMLGASLENVQKQIKKLQDLSLIRYNDGDILLIDSDKLEALTNSEL